MRYIVNAFTPAMLAGLKGIGSAEARFMVLMDQEARAYAEGATSAIGHQGTADFVSARLGLPCPMARLSLALNAGDELVICQLSGPRLPEGRILTAAEVAAAGVTFILATIG